MCIRDRYALCAKLSEVKPSTQASPVNVTTVNPVKTTADGEDRKTVKNATLPRHEDRIVFADEGDREPVNITTTTEGATQTTEGDAEITTIENRNIFDAPKRDTSCGEKMKKDNSGRCRQVYSVSYTHLLITYFIRTLRRN